MKLTLVDPKYLKESVSIISELVTEATFKLSSESVDLIAMDPANVAMVIFKLLGSAFTEYDIGKDEYLSINLNSLKQVLRRAKSNDTITLEVDENKLKITLKGASKRTFYLTLINIEDEKEKKVPDLKFAATITTQSPMLNEAIEDADIVGESVTLTADSKTFTVSASGDLNKASIDISADANTKITSSNRVSAKYSIEYLKKMIQGSKLSEAVTVEFAKEYPLKLKYLEKNKVQLEFILAPRVDND